MSENDFECFASTGVNAPETMVRLESAVTRFSDADFWQDIVERTRYKITTGLPTRAHAYIACKS